MITLERAGGFIWREARLVERAAFACRFLDGSSAHVRDAVRAYRNADGGVGHAMEPDLRAPGSQPLFVEVALRALHNAGVRDVELAEGTCVFLASVASGDGVVQIILPDALEYPRAAHWTTLDPPGNSPNPTAALVGLLHWQGAVHPWLDRATEWCWRRLQEPIDEAHALRCALTFLQFVPDRARAQALALTVARQAYTARFFRADPDGEEYGLTPLQLAPSPDAVGRPAFSDDLIAAHLDALLTSQQEDGGWPIAWTPPSRAAEMEWRGVMTLEALTILQAYGRL